MARKFVCRLTRILAPLLLPLLGCASPMKSIEPDIAKFTHDSPDHFAAFAGRSRTMQLAWSGNPKKRPLLFVHGSPGNWKAWAAFLRNPELTENFHVLVVDRPGFGGSGAGTVETRLAVQAADLIEALRFNESGLPAILIGHSYGGPVIARMAMDYPKQVAGLVFVAAAVDPKLEKNSWYQYPARWSIFEWLVPRDLDVSNHEILALKSELEKMLPLWSALRIPYAIIQGVEDDLVPPANADFLRQHLDRADLVSDLRLPQMNHFIPWRRPEVIAMAIQSVRAQIK